MNLTNYITFVKAHEKLIIIGLSALLLYRTGQGIENAWIRHEQIGADKAAQVVTSDAASNKSLSDQLAQLKTDTQKQNDQLSQDIAAKLAGLKQQQAVDQQMSQQQILDRWKLLLPLKPGAVTASNGTDQITTDAATQTVQALEQIPVLKLDIQDLSQELVGDALVIVKQADLITGLNVQLVDEKKSHVTDVNLEKSKSKRSWFRGFKLGVVVGVVGVELIRTWAGHP